MRIDCERTVWKGGKILIWHSIFLIKCRKWYVPPVFFKQKSIISHRWCMRQCSFKSTYLLMRKKQTIFKVVPTWHTVSTAWPWWSEYAVFCPSKPALHLQEESLLWLQLDPSLARTVFYCDALIQSIEPRLCSDLIGLTGLQLTRPPAYL